MKFLKLLQNLPLGKRKLVLWLIVGVLGLGLLFWWVEITKERLKKVKGEETKEKFGLPSLQEELNKLPKIEMPKINEETLKKLEEIFKQAEKPPIQ